MTRERFEQIQCEHEQAIKRQAAFGGIKTPLLLWGETIEALKEARSDNERLRKNSRKLSLVVHPDSVEQYVTFSVRRDRDSNTLTIRLDHMAELRP